MENILLSILLPTRQRVALVEKSLASLLDRAKVIKDFEILIAYDDDDHESQCYFQGSGWQKFLEKYQVHYKCFSVPRWGYENLNEYINFLGKQSQGKWLLFWNDDALMETVHWDDHLRMNQDFRGLLHMTCSNLVMNCSLFPLFSRDWIELFGTVSPSNHIDSWISDICWNARARKAIPVSTFHDRFSESGNNNDRVYRERVLRTNDFHSADMKKMREEWTARLKKHLSMFTEPLKATI